MIPDEHRESVDLIERVVDTFGFQPHEAVTLILKWKWKDEDLDLWEQHLGKLGKDPKVHSPKALCLTLMRQQSHPEKQRQPTDSKWTLVKEIVERHQGKLYRGKKGDYWRVIPQGLHQIEDGRVLPWSDMTMEDLKKVDRDVMEIRDEPEKRVSFGEWVGSDDCRDFIREHKAAGVEMAWLERLHEKALAGAPVSPRELLK